MLEQKAKEIRRIILETTVNTGQAHLGGALSTVEILLALYSGKILNVTPKTINSPNRDRFIFSKGHCPLALYSILADNGFLNKKELKKYGTICMPGHIDYHTPGVEITSGSLGYGLGIGCGMALAAKMDKKDYKTYVLLGDTECSEGSIWEAVAFASSKELNNLIAIVDNNKLGVLGLTTKYASKKDMKHKWFGFGWNVYEVDGHDINQLLDVFNLINRHITDCPSVIIANTIKGKGISFMENNPKWHHGIPKGEELIKAREELK